MAGATPVGEKPPRPLWKIIVAIVSALGVGALCYWTLGPGVSTAPFAPVERGVEQAVSFADGPSFGLSCWPSTASPAREPACPEFHAKYVEAYGPGLLHTLTAAQRRESELRTVANDAYAHFARSAAALYVTLAGLAAMIVVLALLGLDVATSVVAAVVAAVTFLSSTFGYGAQYRAAAKATYQSQALQEGIVAAMLDAAMRYDACTAARAAAETKKAGLPVPQPLVAVTPDPVPPPAPKTAPSAEDEEATEPASCADVAKDKLQEKLVSDVALIKATYSEVDDDLLSSPRFSPLSLIGGD